MSADELITGEERIIAEFLAPLTMGDAGALGLKDDCAVMMPPPGHELVLTTDSLIEGVHFLPGEIPAFKALAVNVSDLVAKGATREDGKICKPAGWVGPDVERVLREQGWQ